MTGPFLLLFVLLLATFCACRDDYDDDSSKELIALHKTLVEIESITGGPGGSATKDNDERNMQKYIQSWLETQSQMHHLDIQVHLQEVTPGRDNLYAFAGKDMKARVMLTSHVDTVPPYVPYRIDGDHIYGRGTNDDKGCVAAQLIAFRDLLLQGKAKPGDLALLFVVGEEIGGEGMQKVPELGLAWEAVVFGEPTDNKLARGQIGGLVFNASARGVASHSGFPHLGVSAIEHTRKTMDVLHGVLHRIEERPRYGTNSVTLGRMAGGQADNAVPDSAWVSGSYRTTIDPNEITELLGPMMNERLCPDQANEYRKYRLNKREQDKETEKPCDFLELRWLMKEMPMDIDHDIPGGSLSLGGRTEWRATRLTTTGAGFETFAAAFGSDITFLPGEHKKYLFGPGSITSAHKDIEFVSKRELMASLVKLKTIILYIISGDTDSDMDTIGSSGSGDGSDPDDGN